MNQLVVSLLVAGVISSEVGESGDACSLVNSSSVCVGEGCSHLFWADRESGLFFVEPTWIIDGPMSAVSCAEAHLITTGLLVVQETFFDIEATIQRIRDFSKLMPAISLGLDQFPRIDMELFRSQIERMIELVSTPGPEALIAVRCFGQSTEVRIFQDTVQEIADELALQGAAVDKALLGRFNLFAELADRLGNAADPTGILGVDVKPFLNTYSPVAYGEIEPLSESDAERAGRFTRVIEDVVEASRRMHLAHLTGTLSGPIYDAGIVLFLEAGKLLSTISYRPDVDPCNRILEYLYETRVCPNVAIVAEYITLLVPAVWLHLSYVYLGVGTMASLCQDLTTASDRIGISSIFGRAQPRSSYHQLVVLLRPETVNAESDDFLTDAYAMRLLDVVLIIQGSEHVGYIGQRKQWINQLVDRYFAPNGDRFDEIWQFTDDSRRFFSLRKNSNLSFVRAAGRIMGLAIKYDIPMAVSLAPSFLKRLVILMNPTVDVDGLLRDEDPAFLAGLEELRGIDWESPPPTMEWLDFEGLVPDGESRKVTEANVGEFIRLRKESRLFWSNLLEFRAFRNGIADRVGYGVFGMLSLAEWQERVLPPSIEITPAFVIAGIDFRNFDSTKESHVNGREWIAHAIGGMTTEQLYLFNIFVTGVKQPPVTAAIEPWIKLFFEPSLSPDSLPRSHTCHNELQMPLYETPEQLQLKLMKAVTETNTIDGYAGYPGDDEADNPPTFV